MQNKIKWSEFGRDFVRQLLGLFRPMPDDKQPLMRKIVIYMLILLIGLMGGVGMAYSGYYDGLVVYVLILVGLAATLIKDIKRIVMEWLLLLLKRPESVRLRGFVG